MTDLSEESTRRHAQETALIAPYGGKLVDLVVPIDELDEVTAHAHTLPTLQISERSVCDLMLLATGGFSPLDRFMGSVDHWCVVAEMRLERGHLFPIPVTLPVERDAQIKLDQDIALRDARNELLAVM